MALAREATALLHGRSSAQAAAETSRKTFEDGAAAEGLPSIGVSAARLAGGLPLFDAFIEAGLIASKGEGRRHIAASALKVNDVPCTDERALSQADVRDGAIKLSVGKKKHALVRIE